LKPATKAEQDAAESGARRRDKGECGPAKARTRTPRETGNGHRRCGNANGKVASDRVAVTHNKGGRLCGKAPVGSDLIERL